MKENNYKGFKLGFLGKPMIDAWLLYEKGLKHQEIAKEMGLSINTIHGYVSAVRTYIKWEKETTK